MIEYEGIKWPNGARMAVSLTIHVDGNSLYNWRPVTLPRSDSYGNYGPEQGVDKILELTKDYQVPCTYYVPGQIADRYPDMVKKIDSLGHEVAFHGYDHEKKMFTDRPKEEWKKVIERSQESFERIIGKRAVGFCATSSDFSMEDVKTWYEMGFEYSSSMRGDDRPYRTAFDGEASDFIEIPARWELDDYPAFVYNFAPPRPKGQCRVSNYTGILNNWKHEFDGYCQGGLCMVFMLHPQIIAVPGRLKMLEELIVYMKSHKDVWFAAQKDIAAWWREEY